MDTNIPWVQIAIDVIDLDKMEKLAKIALAAGADWVEAGTPLITFQGINSIGKLVEICGSTPVIADFKAQDGVGKYFIEAGRQGAKAAVVLGCVPNGGIKAAVSAGKKENIKVMTDMFSINIKDIPKRAKEIEAIGVDFVMLHLGFDESRDEPHKYCLDGLDELVKAVSIPVGVGTFNQDDAVEAIKRGASFIVQGEPLLSSEDSIKKITNFINAVKRAG